MRSFRVSFQLLRHAWRPILVFELLLKTVTLLVLVPMLGGLLRLLLQAAHLHYLANANLLEFLRAPITWLGLFIVLLNLALYTLFELSAVTCCYSNARCGRKTSLLEMLRVGWHTVRDLFRRGNGWMVLHLLLLLPVMQFSVLSGSFTMIGIPDFFAYFLTRKIYLLPLYLLFTAGCAALVVRRFFAIPIFTLRGGSFRAACRRSKQLTQKKTVRIVGSVACWNLLHLAVMTVLLCLFAAGVLLVQRKTENSAFWNLFSAQFLRLLVQGILLLFFCAAVPLAAAHMTALYDACERSCICDQEPELQMPRRVLHVSSRRVTFGIAGCICACAIGLHMFYLQGIFTGDMPLRLSARPQITAHRGLSSAAPENTADAFEAAIAMGVDCIELDVQQTKDGVPVVIHDANLKRTAGVNRTVREMTYDQLQELDVGSWFSPRYAGAKIMRLEDVLALTQGQVRLNIEIKASPHTPELEQAVAELIEAYDFVDACCVTSFSYRTLQRIKACNPDIATGYLMSLAYGDFYTLPDADAFSINKLFITRQMVLQAHRNGKAIFAWTVNSASEMQSLKRMQVDDIITDRPQLAEEVFSKETMGDTLLSVLDYLIH